MNGWAKWVASAAAIAVVMLVGSNGFADQQARTDNRVTAVDLKTGRKLWMSDVDRSTASLVVHESCLVAIEPIWQDGREQQRRLVLDRTTGAPVSVAEDDLGRVEAQSLERGRARNLELPPDLVAVHAFRESLGSELAWRHRDGDEEVWRIRSPSIHGFDRAAVIGRRVLFGYSRPRETGAAVELHCRTVGKDEDDWCVSVGELFGLDTIWVHGYDLEVVDDLVVLQTRGWLVALDETDGSAKWKIGLLPDSEPGMEESQVAESLHGATFARSGDHLVVAMGRSVSGVDIATRTLLWQFDPLCYPSSPNVVVSGDSAFMLVNREATFPKRRPE